jgi:hypothetical protein
VPAVYVSRGESPQPVRHACVSTLALRLKTTVLVALVILLAAASTLAWRQQQELTELRAAQLGLDDRRTVEAQLSAYRKRIFALEAELAARGGKLAGGKSEADAKADKKAAEVALLAQLATLPGSDAESKRDADLELLAAMADLPEFQQMLAMQQRGKVDEKYAALFKRLKLSPQELTQLQTLLADRQGAFADAMLAARDQGLTGKQARDMANTVAKAETSSINSSIKDLLGPQRYGQLENYEKTMPQRQVVDQLAQRLSYTNTPLSARQQDQLVQDLATTVVTKPPTKTATGAQPGTTILKPAPAVPVASLPGAAAGLGLGASSSVTISNTAVSRAQSFLTPAQLSALQRMQQEQQAQQTLANLLRTGKVNPPPPVKRGPGGM